MRKRRMLSLLTALALCLSLLPATALATGDKTEPGYVDDNNGHPKYVRDTFDFVVGDIAYSIVDNGVEVAPWYWSWKGHNCAQHADNVFAGSEYTGDTITIPSEVTYNEKTYNVVGIGDAAFANASGYTVIFPNSENFTYIGNSVFSNTNPNMTSVTIPASVTHIGDYSFALNTDPVAGEESIDVVIPENSKLQVIGDYAFANNSAVKELDFPDTLTTIGQFAFSKCTSLASITIPASVTNLETATFDNYYNAEANDGAGNVSFAEGSIFKIQDGVLYDNEWLIRVLDWQENVVVPDGIKYIGADAFNAYDSDVPNAENILKSITFPESLVSIGNWAFRSCKALTNVIIPKNVAEIGTGAFNGCTGLTTAAINGPVTELNQTFNGCTNLETVTLPETIEVIGSSTFNKCAKLTSLDFSNVKKIGNEAFAGTGLTSFIGANELTEIGENAFQECPNLQTVIYPEGIETVPYAAFVGCTALNTVILPGDIREIGSGAFYGAFASGGNLVMQGTTAPTLADMAFNDESTTPESLSVYYPVEAQEAYQTAGLIDEDDTNGYALSLTDSSMALVSNESAASTLTLKATVPTGMTLVTTSSNTDVATANGATITGVAEGTATITAQLKVGEYVVLEDSCTVTVTPAPVQATGITLNETSVTLHPVSAPNTVTLQATVEPSGSTDTVTWESSDTDVATVENGVVTAVGVGEATITAKVGNFSATCAVTVAYAPVESVTLSETSLSLPVSGTVTLEASVTPEDAEPTVVWSSSDGNVATVENGVVTAVSEGEATITATVGGKEAVCVITVTNEGAVLPAVEEPKTDTDKITDEDDKKTAGEVAGSVAADETIASAAQSAASSLNNSSEKEELIAEGEKSLSPTEDQTVSLYTQTYLSIEATKLENDNNNEVTSITLDITPMVRVVASTATNSADIKLDSNGDTNAVVVKNAEELKITASAEITVTLPESFYNNIVFVKHEASNGGIYFYKATADGTGKLTFTSYHGFSPFTFSLTNEAVAEVNNVGYAFFQEAIDAVQDGQSITVYRSGLSATVSGNKTFYVTLADGVSQYPNLIAADGYVLLDNGKGIYTVYKRSASSGGVTPSTHDITVDSGSHGDVEIWPEEAKQGTTVTITATPDKGYEVAEVIVTDENGKEITVTDKGDGKYTFMMPGSDVTIEVTFQAVSGGSTSGGDLTITVPAGWVNPYTDVAASAWYYDAVGYATANGLMGGVGNNAFAPNGSMNRAMVWTVIARLAGQTISGESWAADAQAWAVAQGVSDGTNPDGSVSREELVTMLYRYAGSPAMNVPELALIGGYPDSANVSAWAQNAFAWAISKGVIEGRDGKLAAGDSVTRAEAATILARFHLLTK